MEVLFSGDVVKGLLKSSTFGVPENVGAKSLPVYITPVLQFRASKLAFGGSNPTEHPYLDGYNRQYITGKYVTTFFIQTMGCLEYRDNQLRPHQFPEVATIENTWTAGTDNSTQKALDRIIQTNMNVWKFIPPDVWGGGNSSETYAIYIATRESKEKDIFEGYFTELPESLLFPDGKKTDYEQGILEGTSVLGVKPIEGANYIESYDMLRNLLGASGKIPGRGYGDGSKFVAYLPQFTPSGIGEKARSIYYELTLKYNTTDNIEGDYMSGYCPRFGEPVDFIFTSQAHKQYNKPVIDGMGVPIDGSDSTGNFIVMRVWFGVEAINIGG